jgi:hypothetical protein
MLFTITLQYLVALFRPAPPSSGANLSTPSCQLLRALQILLSEIRLGAHSALAATNFNLFCSFKFRQIKDYKSAMWVTSWNIGLPCLRSQSNDTSLTTVSVPVEQGGVHGTLASRGTTIQTQEYMIQVTPQSILPPSCDAINSASLKSPATQI